MEEKEQLRRQIRLLQGLIDDYKTLHGNGPALGNSSATRWQPPVFPGGRTFGARYSRPSRRGFSSHHGPSWRKKYSLVNQPVESSDPASDPAFQTSLSIPGDKKNSPTTATTSKNHLTQRRRQALRGKNSPVLRKTPHKGLMQVNRHRLCCLPSSRTHLSTKEASSVHMGIPPSNKVIKTRYRIVKKTPSSSFGAPSFPSSLPSWRARRIPLSRSLVLNRLRPAITGGGKAPPGTPRWRNKGYRCIGGVLYKVSANKLSKTSSRPSDGNRTLLRTGFFYYVDLEALELRPQTHRDPPASAS